ncbi:TVP38/TMEM64 family protein [Caldibacillus debilis]|uniref:TVP38/TMEM64 family membrane protein n=1 Tax=Caldibacillus debilis TaxID=301148 RepID=A0A150LEB1_9BACI|nr:TVP38/TMEM64 family protein [Caldibacillus debilis]KYD10585.1 hypothetical protein B4135_3386 [Caldibacillus debilis]
MDFTWIKEFFTMENLMELIQNYRSLGPLTGIFLPLLESFFPFLPLFLFVMANANAFGLWWGFLFSWIGSSAGALLVFALVRIYGQKKLLRFLSTHHRVQRLMNWVERHGFGPLFLLLCFPFTPSAVVNVVAGLSKVNVYQFALAVISGKMVMIFTISFVGHDIPSLIRQPLRTCIVIVVIAVLWYLGKRVENYLNAKMEKEHRPVKIVKRERMK